MPLLVQGLSLGGQDCPSFTEAASWNLLEPMARRVRPTAQNMQC